MRIISSKRNPKTGELYHSCPRIDSHVVTPEACGVSVKQCEFLTWFECLEASYRVHCNYVSDIPIEFEPPKAHSSFRGLTGPEVLKSEDHPWIERKLDGVRAIVHCMPTGVVITSRRLNKLGVYNQFQDCVPHLRDDNGLLELGERGHTILDGEVIMPVDDDTLAVTMGVVGSKPERAVELQEERGRAVLHLFDTPWVYGSRVSSLSLRERHAFLTEFFASTLRDSPSITLVPHDVIASLSTRQTRLAVLMTEGFEGVVVKNPDAGYFDSRAWLKVKARVTVDALVAGWEPGAVGSKYSDTLGALCVSVRTADGKLREIARVAPGDEETREALFRGLSPLTEEEIVGLGLIVEMEAQSWTKDGRLRHPRILRFRSDRSEPNAVLTDSE